MFVPGIVLGASLTGAFIGGDLDLDLKRLARSVRPDVPRPSKDTVEQLWQRHPANPLISVQVAYLKETAEPPDYEGALQAANRTLFLAPTYADGHLIAGRILLRRGYRSQGLLSIRQGWALSGSRPDLVRHAIALCRDAEEVWRTLPRADPVFDRPHGGALALAARMLGQQDRREVAVELLERTYDDSAATPAELEALAAVRTRFGLLERTLSAVRIRRITEPKDPSLRLSEAKVLLRLGRPEDAKRLLEEGTSPSSGAGLSLWFDVCLASGDLEGAEEALKGLKYLAAGAFNERIVLKEVRLRGMQARPRDALEALNDALERRPSSVALRTARARLLIEQGRPRRARTDVRLILRRVPKDPQAEPWAVGSGCSRKMEP